MRIRALTLVVSALTALGMLSAPAQASTGGTPDGETHPNVAFLLAYSGGERFSCSGTLVSPTVVLTAGHCTDQVSGSVLVTFESDIDDEAPLKFDPAADPAAGFTDAEIAAEGARSGTAESHPDYSDFTDLDNWNDVGVVLLGEPVTDITPAVIADQGTLGGIKKSNLSKVALTAVGYGAQFVKPEGGPQKKQALSYPLMRRYVAVVGQKLTPQILQAQGSVNKNKGTGGTCFGDSGGPLFLNGEVVAVTSYGNNDKCANIAGYQRVDIAVVQDWLVGEFGVLAG